MPKLPVVRAKQLLKVLIKLGFFKHHQSGSHIQLKHPDGRRTTVPYHPSYEIRPGTLKSITLKSILDDIEISTDEFIKLLKK